MYCYFNGVYLKELEASIPIHTLGVQRGFGIFDLFRGRNGNPVFLEDHLDRFDRSQAFLGLDQLIAKNEIRNAIHTLQEMNGFKESTFKLMLLGDGDESEPMLKPLFYIINSDVSSLRNPPSANVILYEYLREYPSIKSVNYLTSTHLHRKKVEARAIDVVYHSDGAVSEASRSNVFMVKDGELFTPSENILLGVTRKNVLSFAKSITQVSVQDISVDMLKSADEVFITSTLKEVLPIVSIDGTKVGEGRIGAYTNKIQQAFSDLLH